RFEDKVEEALNTIDGAQVERRPEPLAGRTPDFLVTIGGHRVIVESYLPPRPQRAYLIRRIEDRRRLRQRFEASAVAVVLPDGIPPDVIDVPKSDDVEVTTLKNVDAAIQSAAAR